MRFLLLAVALVRAALPVSAAGADPWYEHHARAQKALAAEEWSRAIEEVNRALEKRADSGARVRTYGMKVVDYFPYLDLGIAYYHLGELEAALQALETEERLGAVAASEEGRATLERYRTRVEEARDAARAEEEARRRRLVLAGLSEAERLEAAGDLAAALTAAGKALALEPENARALGLMDRLQAEAARRRNERSREERVSRLLAEGRRLLTGGDFAGAAGTLRRVLALGPNAEASRLLEAARDGLRTAAAGSEDELRRRRIREGLAAAREREAAGGFGAALEEVQQVLALDPDHSEALAAQDRLLAAQAATAAERERREEIADLLAGVETDLAAARFEQAVVTVHRLLAVDPGNPTALDHLATAYREIGRRLLGGGPRRNIPPAIRFVDQRRELADGSRVQVVAEPRLRLSGFVLDDSPVEIALPEAAEEVETAYRSQALGDLYLTEFTLDSRLPVGLSTFRLVATDADRQSSSSEYRVVYERPWVRSPAVVGGAAVVLLAVFGLLLERRAARRRRLLKRRFNPFVAGSPVVGDDLFFGREELLDRILETIHNNSLLLFGERRIGKTSIQHQLKKRLQALEDPDYVFYPVYVDLQGTPEEQFFGSLAEDLFDQLAPHLGGLKPRQPAAGLYAYRELVRDLHDLLRRLQETSSRKVKVVLLIDEVDELNAYDPRINQKLRSLFMKSFAEHLVAVVSGVEIRRRWEREGSPWYNFFEEIEVPPFRFEEARELIEKPIRGVFRVEAGVVERIVAVTDGKPYLIQKLCVALVNRLHAARRRKITVADVEAVGRPSEV